MRIYIALLLVLLVMLTSFDVSASGYPEYRPNAPAVERPHLTKSGGVFYGPSGKETYYNLNMSRVVSAMRDLGYSEEEYPYTIRPDGAKMLGEYVMCAADYRIRPKGTILETSLGWAIVCDTGTFVHANSTQIDLAVDW